MMLAVLSFPLLSLGCASNRPARPLATGGLLDLRHWDFERDGAARLSGDWDFFPDALMSGQEALGASRVGGQIVPGHWKGKATGAGTYRLKVLLPSRKPSLGVKFTTVSTAFELDAAGVLVASAGRPAMERSSATAAYKPGVALLPECADSVLLVVRVSNYEYRIGGMWRPFYLGSAAALQRQSWLNELIALALASSLAILAVVFAFFIRGGAEGTCFVYFCLFSASTALRSLVTGEYVLVRLFPTIGFDAVIRLEYLGAYTIYPLCLLFFSSFFSVDRDSRAVKASLILCAAFLLLVPIAPLPILTWSILPYYAVAAVVIAVIVALLAKAVAHGRAGSLPVLVGAIALVAAGISEILFANFIAETGNLFPYGMLIFIGAQAYALAQRHVRTQDELRQALAEKELLIREVHHRVKNSLQIVSSIASLQAHRVEDPAAIAAYNAIQARIRAISLVHEKLYALDSNETVDIGMYARDLASMLAESFGVEGEGSPLVEADSMAVPADLCIDFGLVMTELVSNAYKYSGMPGHRSMIRIRIRNTGTALSLVVEDDGPGFPEGYSYEKTSTLGFRLVATLAKKRRASVDFRKGPGAAVEILFPMREPLAV
jgi:two-component sensor histidine kinase